MPIAGSAAEVHEPLHRWVPPVEESYGDLACGLAEQVGMVMDDEQRDILNAIYAEDEPGVPACFEVGVVAPRQNLKTSTLEIAALTDVFVLREPLHVWTAHLFSTTRKSFEHMVELIGSSEDLRSQCVWPPRASHGEEAIELLTGETIEFRARSKGGGRGFAGVSKITFDEALFLSALAMGALMPTLATRRDAQIRYGSSGGLEESAALRDIRDRGRAGGDPRLAYFEFGAPLAPCALGDECPHVFLQVQGKGCALDREDLWMAANPALGRRISWENMRAFRRSMPWQEFSREFLTWWEDPPPSAASDAAIDMDVWRARRDPRSRALDPVVVGLDVSPQRVTSISVAGWRADGRIHGELVQSAPGTGWVVPMLLDIVTAVDPAVLVIDGKGAVTTLLPDIRAEGLDPQVLTAGERAQADDGLVKDLEQDRMRLPGVEMPALDNAADAATWRTFGDLRFFERRAGAAGISPMVSLSCARFGLLTAAAQPQKPPPRAPEPVKAEPAAAGREIDLMSAGF